MRLGKTAFCVVLVLIWFLFLHPRHTTVLSETLFFCFGVFDVVVALGLICSCYFVVFFPWNNLRCCVRLIDLLALIDGGNVLPAQGFCTFISCSVWIFCFSVFTLKGYKFHAYHALLKIGFVLFCFS